LALITQVSSVIVGEVSREYGNYIDQWSKLNDNDFVATKGGWIVIISWDKDTSIRDRDRCIRDQYRSFANIDCTKIVFLDRVQRLFFFDRIQRLCL
jgi:hypothetical protein